MIKQEIRSLIRNSLPKFDKNAMYHNLYIDACVEKVLAGMYEDVWRMSPLNLQRYTKRYSISILNIIQEVDTNIYYSDLPVSIIPFQDKASGVRRISTIAQGGFTFFPMDFREMDLVASGCYFNTVNTKIGYAVDQTRVEYFNMDPVVANTGVRMDLIIPFSKYDENDEVKIPEMVDLKTGESFIDKVIKILKGIPLVDLKDDNAAPEGQQKDN